MTTAPPAPRSRRRPSSNSARMALGFRDGAKGAHSSRTLMLAELRVLLAATPPSASPTAFCHLVVEDNLLGKRTASNRVKAQRILAQLYGLDPDIPIYRLFRRFWDADVAGRPLLALLAACARDPLLRAAAPDLLGIPFHEIVPSERIQAALSSVSSRFTANTIASISRNVASSFTQSGHLQGVLHKRRVRAQATPSTAAFAAALGWMEGARGQFLLSSFWARLLDCNRSETLDLLLAADRSGWLDIRAAAGIVEIRMDRLLSPTELELCRGQQA